MNVKSIRVERGSVYLVPGGPHVIGFRLRKALAGFFGPRILLSDEIQVCLLAQPGHHYTTATVVESGDFKKRADVIYGDAMWEQAASAPRSALRIVDAAEGEVPVTCDPARIFPAATPPPSNPPAAVEPAPAVTPPPSTPTEAASAVPEIMGLWSKDEIRRIGPTEAATAAPGSTAFWAQDELRRSRHPVFEVTGSIGFDVGGQDVARAQFSDGSSESLTTGEGVVFRAGVMVTPLWLAADRIGLGAGADVAVKSDIASPTVDTSSTAAVALTRYPWALTLHALVRYTPVLYVYFAGGFGRDERVSVSGDANATVTGVTSLTSRVGGTGRLGFYWAAADRLALIFGLEYTNRTYDSPAGSVRADSAGLSVTFIPRLF
jgi:hypothetical protein